MPQFITAGSSDFTINGICTMIAGSSIRNAGHLDTLQGCCKKTANCGKWIGENKGTYKLTLELHKFKTHNFPMNCNFGWDWNPDPRQLQVPFQIPDTSLNCTQSRIHKSINLLKSSGALGIPNPNSRKTGTMKAGERSSGFSIYLQRNSSNLIYIISLFYL